MRTLPPDEVEVFPEIEQGSEQWISLRLGLPTASNFGAIMANGRDGGPSLTRAKLLRQLAGEVLTGEPAEQYRNSYMDRGNLMEAEAREHYSFAHEIELERVGFVKRTIHREFGNPLIVGCSPDSLIGKDRVLEIKTLAPHLMIDLIEKGTAPREHRAQCQGALWVTGRAVCELMVYYRGMPLAPTFKFERDEYYISQIREAVEVFEYDLKALVKKIRDAS